jgi:hypothetical protein
LERLAHHYPLLLVFLTAMRVKPKWEAACVALIAKLIHSQTAAMVMLLRDVTVMIDVRNKQLQRDGLRADEVAELVLRLKEELQLLVVRENGLLRQSASCHISAFTAFMSAFDSSTGMWPYAKGRQVKLEVSPVYKERAVFEQAALDFMQRLAASIVLCLDERFPTSAHVKMLQVLTPSHWRVRRKGEDVPEESRSFFIGLIGQYSLGASSKEGSNGEGGRESDEGLPAAPPIFLLPDKAHPKEREEQVKAYMEQAKEVADELHDLYNKRPGITFAEAWLIIGADVDVCGKFAAWHQLAQLLMVAPVQSATVGRGFSAHRILKGRLSNRLKVTTLDSIMRVRQLLSRDVITSHPLEAAVNVFLQQSPRSGVSPLTSSRWQSARAASNLGGWCGFGGD